jgi:hypothetical protein
MQQQTYLFNNARSCGQTITVSTSPGDRLTRLLPPAPAAINHSNNQPINQSVHQSINQSFHQWFLRAIHPAIY